MKRLASPPPLPRPLLCPLLLGLIAFSPLALSEAGAATVTRGPYLQMGGPAGIVVRWRTDVATDSRVRYGSA